MLSSGPELRLQDSIRDGVDLRSNEIPATRFVRRLGCRLADFCRDDTVTGHEDRGLPKLIDWLEELGADVHLQEVAPDRTNVLACWGSPRVLFATHFDTVPPALECRVDDEWLECRIPGSASEASGVQLVPGAVFGRGACDAKGQIVAQLGAIETLLAAGESDVGWLGVVGEETHSDGAAAALTLKSRLPECAAIVVGEPTDLLLATGQRGILHLRLRTCGRAAHSSTPENGHNAIEDLVAWLAAIESLEWASDAELGEESCNLSRIEGGTAPNVVPDAAEAELFCRVLQGSTIETRVRALAPPGGETEVLLQREAVRFSEIHGFARGTVPFGSDAPVLAALARAATPGSAAAAGSGTVVLAGPGSIDVAHTEEEHLSFADLWAGIDLNRRLALHFLRNAP